MKSEEVKQEEPEIETVDIKNNVVETAEVKTDDQEKIDEEFKKSGRSKT